MGAADDERAAKTGRPLENDITESAPAVAEDEHATRTRVAVLAGTAAFLSALHVAYLVSVVPRWSALGLIDASSSDGSLLFAYVIALLPAFIMPTGVGRPSDMILWVLYPIAYVPAVVMPYHVLGEGWSLAPLTLSLAVGFGVLLLMQSLPTVRGPALVTEESFADGALVLIAVALTGLIVGSVGLSLELPDLDAVYDVRAMYAETIREVGTLPAYAIGTAGNALNPALIVRGIERRRPLLVAVGFLGQSLIYASTGFRSIFLASFLVVLLYLAFRWSPRSFGAVVIWSLAGVVIVSMAAHIILEWFLPSDLFIRRMLAVPGQLVGYYFEFFSTHPPYELSHSLLGIFNPQPYPATQAQTIAYVYFGHPDASANANLWADGFANFRFAGIFGMTVVAAAVLKLADGVSYGRQLSIAAPTLAVAAFSLTNSSVLTSLLSHGIAPALFIVLLMPRGRSPD